MSLVWITGGHGFIGRHLARHLAGQRQRIIGIGHGAWSLGEAMQWGFSAWMGGELSSNNFAQLRHDHGVPDTIYHLAGGSSVGAAFADPNDDFTRTVVSTSALLEWMRRDAPSTRLVAVSSAAVYGSGHDGEISENAQLSPFSPYGTHKLMMEKLCDSYAINFGVRVVLPRLFSVYGPGLKKQFIWDLCSKLDAGGSIELGGTGCELRDWTHVDDIIEALRQVSRLASDRALTLNLATGIGTTVRDVTSAVISHWAGASSQSVQYNGRSRLGDPFSLVADIARMNSFGIKCRISIAEGSAEYVDWFRGRISQKDYRLCSL